MRVGYGSGMHRSANHGSSEHANDEPLAYSVKNAARALDISERTMRHLLATGEIPSVKVGGSRRVPRAELLAYINQKLAA